MRGYLTSVHLLKARSLTTKERGQKALRQGVQVRKSETYLLYDELFRAKQNDV